MTYVIIPLGLRDRQPIVDFLVLWWDEVGVWICHGVLHIKFPHCWRFLFTPISSCLSSLPHLYPRPIPPLLFPKTLVILWLFDLPVAYLGDNLLLHLLATIPSFPLRRLVTPALFPVVSLGTVNAYAPFQGTDMFYGRSRILSTLSVRHVSLGSGWTRYMMSSTVWDFSATTSRVHCFCLSHQDLWATTLISRWQRQLQNS